MTEYERALRRGKRHGAVRCDDSALMALVLDSTAQLLCGAVSSRLVWDGAQKVGMTSMQLAELMNYRPCEIEELQWSVERDIGRQEVH